MALMEAFTESRKFVSDSGLIVPKKYVKNATTDLNLHLFKMYEMIDDIWQIVKTNIRIEKNTMYVKERGTQEEWEYHITGQGELYVDAAISWFLYPNETLENLERMKLKGLSV